ncbi:unnamed protein product, partial [Phaeothamnion confervicola]
GEGERSHYPSLIFAEPAKLHLKEASVLQKMGLRSRVLTAVVVLPVAWALLQQKLTSFLVGFFIQAAAIEEWERAACKKPHGSRLVAHAQAAACFVAGTFGAAAADLAFVAAWLLGTTWRLLQVGAVARAKGGAAAG